MAPGETTDMPPEEQKKYCLKAIRPDFPEDVKPGDVVVTGRNFGCGSSRETAARNLKMLGVSVILSDSVARIFFRNCIAIGLPIFIQSGVNRIFEDGDVAEVDIETGEIKNLKSRQKVIAKKLPAMMLAVLKAGGIIPLLKQKIAHAS